MAKLFGWQVTMFERMNGRQLAGWGYGIFWVGLLIELINALIGASQPQAGSGPLFWVGVALAMSCVGSGIGMLTQIRHRPW